MVTKVFAGLEFVQVMPSLELTPHFWVGRELHRYPIWRFMLVATVVPPSVKKRDTVPPFGDFLCSQR